MATTKISTVIGIGAELTSGFRQTFGGLDAALGKTAGRVRELNTAAGQIGGLRKLQEALPKSADKLEGAKVKLEALREQLKAAGGNSDELKNKIGEQEARVRGLQEAYDKQEKAVRDTTEALKKAGVDTGHLADEEKRLAAESAKATAVMKAQAGVKTQLGNVKKSMGELRSSAMLAVASFTAAGFGLHKLVGGAAEAGDEAAKTAVSLNMSSQALQEWRFIGAKAGISAEGITGALTSLNMKLDEAVLSGGAARDVLGELNLDPDTLRAASATQRVQMIGKAMQNYHGYMSKAQLTQALFGKGALRMQGVLEMSADEQRKLAQEAVRSGYVQTKAQVEAAEAYRASMESAKAAITGVRNQFAMKLMPTFTAGMNWLTRNTWALKAAFVAIGVVLTTACVVSIVKLGRASVDAYKDVALLVRKMIELGTVNAASGKAGVFAKMATGAKSVIPWLMKIGGAIIPFVVTAFTSGAAVISAAISSIPIVGWIAAAVTLVGILVWKYWTPIKKFFLDLGQTIGGAFVWGFGIAKKAVSGFVGFFRGIFNFIAGVGRRIMDVVLAPFRAIKRAIEWVLSKLGIGGGAASNAAKTGDVQSIAARQGRRTTQEAMAMPSARQPKAISIAAAQGRRGAPANVTNNTFTIHTQPGQSPEQFADAVVKKIDARDREKARAAYSDMTPAYAGGAA